MTHAYAQTILRQHRSPYTIEKNDCPVPRWRIQLGDGKGAVTFRTLEDAVQFAVHAPLPAREDKAAPYWQAPTTRALRERCPDAH